MVLGIDFLKDVDSFWVAKRSQVGSKIVPKIDPGGVLGVSWWVLGGSWGPRPNNAMRNPFFGVLLGAFWGRLGVVFGLSLAILGASWPPRQSQKSKKNDIKIELLFDTPWENYILRYCWIFNAKMVPNLLPNNIKFRYGLANTDFIEFCDSFNDFIDFLGFEGWILEAQTDPKSVPK